MLNDSRFITSVTLRVVVLVYLLVYLPPTTDLLRIDIFLDFLMVSLAFEALLKSSSVLFSALSSIN